MEKDKGLKVSLVLLKKFVSELETAMKVSETIMEERKEGTINDYVVEMYKGMGLAAGIAREATLLVGDCRAAIKANTSPAVGATDDLADLLGALGGVPGAGNSGLPGAN